MTTLVEYILSTAVALGVAVSSTSAFAQDSSDRKTAETASSVVDQLEPDVRFTATEPDSEGCRKAVNDMKCHRYYLHRERFLVAETRWLYCTGRIDHLPAWAR